MLGIHIFLLVVIATLVAIFCLSCLAEMLRLVDRPGGRKKHARPTPLVGGLALYIVFASMVTGVLNENVPLWPLGVCAFVLVLGVLDDIRGLSVATRLAAQIGASLFMILFGDLWIKSLGFDLAGFSGSLGLYGVFPTVVAVVGLTNAFNMVDGIDGLAGSHFLIGLSSIVFGTMVSTGSLVFSEIYGLAFAVMLGFMLVNLSLTPIPKVFLGDSGSLLIGFGMSWLLIYVTQNPNAQIHPVIALWCVSVPVFDFISVVTIRISRGLSPFNADRSHLHHVLLKRGFGPYKSLMVITTVSVITNLAGIWLTVSISPAIGMVVYGILLGAYVSIFVITSRATNDNLQHS